MSHILHLYRSPPLHPLPLFFASSSRFFSCSTPVAIFCLLCSMKTHQQLQSHITPIDRNLPIHHFPNTLKTPKSALMPMTVVLQAIAAMEGQCCNKVAIPLIRLMHSRGARNFWH